jgi:hypothetical protein
VSIRGKRSWVTVAAAALTGLLTPGSASGAVTIGSDLGSPPTGVVSGTSTWVQRSLPGQQVTAPTDGVIVRWRLRLGGVTDAQAVKLRVVRGAGAASTGSGSSAPESIPAGQGTYVFETRLPVSAGDYIGIDVTDAATVLRTPPGAQMDRFFPLLGDGETRAPGAQFDNELTINADLEPDCDSDGLGDETQDPNVFPGGNCPRADRTLTLDADKHKVKAGRKVLLFGDLDAPGYAAECESAQTIELQRKRSKQADFATFDRVLAFPTGYYSLKKKVKKTFQYRAQVPETATCAGGTSNTEKVKVKKPK